MSLNPVIVCAVVNKAETVVRVWGGWLAIAVVMGSTIWLWIAEFGEQ